MSTTTERRRIARESSDAPPSGWWNVARRVKDDVAADNVSMIAAGAAFFGLLALFPALAAAVALYGLITDPATVSAHLDLLSGFAPAEARMILDEQLQRITASANTSLGVGAVVALLLAAWSAAKGVKSLMTALDVVYHEREDRGFFHRLPDAEDRRALGAHAAQRSEAARRPRAALTGRRRGGASPP